jgi:hypothetical protein
MEETIKVDKKAFFELAKSMEDIQDKIESLVLMADSEFVESYKKAKQEIADGDLVEFNDL